MIECMDKNSYCYVYSFNLLAVNPERYSGTEFNVKSGNPERYLGNLIILVFVTLATTITQANCRGMSQINRSRGDESDKKGNRKWIGHTLEGDSLLRIVIERK